MRRATIAAVAFAGLFSADAENILPSASPRRDGKTVALPTAYAGRDGTTVPLPLASHSSASSFGIMTQDVSPAVAALVTEITCSSSGVEYDSASAQYGLVLDAIWACGQNTTVGCPSGDLTTETLCRDSGGAPVIQRKFNASLGIGPTATNLRKIADKGLPAAAACEAKIIEDKCTPTADLRINAILGGTLGTLGGIIAVAGLWLCCRRRCASTVARDELRALNEAESTTADEEKVAAPAPTPSSG